ncbi:hypothetical protein D3C72_1780140 [compost metagenome]
MASMEMAIMPALEPTNTLITAPTISTKAPTKSHLPMPEMSRLITVASDAITKNTPAVPANAVMISCEPLLKPSTMAIRRESIRPMKNVKASSTGTPAAECLVFSMANMKPKAPPMNTSRPIKPVSPAVMPVVTPTHAPNTVGSKLSASSQ